MPYSNGLSYTITGRNTVEVDRHENISGDVVIPEKVLFDGDDTPYTVTGIGRRAFWYCENLTSVTLPSTLKEILKGGFFGCKSLTSVTIPDSVTFISDMAFGNCFGLRSVVLPASLKEICAETFFNCLSLTDITLPEGLEIISVAAFGWCKSLTSIAFPASLKHIMTSAFGHCVNLNDIHCSFGGKIIIDQDAFDYGPLERTVYASEGDLDIEDFNATKKVIVETKKRGPAFFRSDCLYYRTINENEVELTGNLEGLCQFDKECYVDVVVPEKVSYEGFEYTVTRVGCNAFSMTKHLRSIVLPSTIETIAGGAFIKSSLSSIALSSSLCCIEEDAFSCCENLTSVTLPPDVKKIGERAFFKCINLKDIICQFEREPIVLARAFDGGPVDRTIYVLDEHFNARKFGASGMVVGVHG